METARKRNPDLSGFHGPFTASLSTMALFQSASSLSSQNTKLRWSIVQNPSVILLILSYCLVMNGNS